MMADCLSNRTVVLGVAVFAALCLLAGAMMASVGLVAFIQLPDLFTTGCVIWTGFVVFVSGAILLLMSIFNKHISLWKSYIMVLLCVTIVVVSAANILLIEVVEWEAVRERKESKESHVKPEEDNNLIFLAYLLGLVGSIIGLVASFFGAAYIYFTLTVPLLRAKEKDKPQYEVEVKKKVQKKYSQKPIRKFSFKLTPPPESQWSARAKWSNDESDFYHVSWVYDQDEAQGSGQTVEASTAGPPVAPLVDNKALMREIRETVATRRPPSTSMDVTAQISPNPRLDGSSLDDQSEPVLGRIGQLPPNARSSFRRKSLEPETQEESTKM